MSCVSELMIKNRKSTVTGGAGHELIDKMTFWKYVSVRDNFRGDSICSPTCSSIRSLWFPFWEVSNRNRLFCVPKLVFSILCLHFGVLPLLNYVSMTNYPFPPWRHFPTYISLRFLFSLTLQFPMASPFTPISTKCSTLICSKVNFNDKQFVENSQLSDLYEGAFALSVCSSIFGVAQTYIYKLAQRDTP